MYRWWVFVHVVGVFGFLSAHGVSMTVLFRLRGERDPGRVASLLQLSSESMTAFYVSLGVLLAGGIVAGFLGHWWGQVWIWAAIAILLVTSFAMYAMATPYYKRVRFISQAMARGSQAVTPEQFDEVLRSGKPVGVAGIGVVALVALLYLMMFKPTFGQSVGGAPARTIGTNLSISARNTRFNASTLTAPAGTSFTIVFDNADPSVQHNVAVYTDRSASTSLFVGKWVTGPATITYHVKALPAGRYFFRCDVHPTVMTGTLVVR